MPSRRSKSNERAPRPLLTFDPHFVPGGSLQVYLWAEHQSRSRIRFEIGPDVLSDMLGGGNPVTMLRMLRCASGSGFASQPPAATRSAARH